MLNAALQDRGPEGDLPSKTMHESVDGCRVFRAHTALSGQELVPRFKNPYRVNFT